MPKKKKSNKKKETDIKSLNNINGIISGFSSEEDIEADEQILEKFKSLKKKKIKIELVKIKNLIGNPKIKDINRLNSELIQKELNRLYELLNKNHIFIHFKNEYDLKEQYRFITQEVLEQKVEKLPNVDMKIKFIYEDFHPEKDIIEEEEED
ncbi:MAG: hypothetical protein N2490_01545 [Ignavibacteria bacterium]|nr:hypothetical protein [Ignavibacteria bacterium]